MWHRLLGILPTLAGLVLWSPSAFAQARTALVIGNSSYEVAKALPNPANDARAVAQLLNQAGFEVVMAFDLNRDLMRQVISEFSAKVAAKGPDTVTLIYYAGHGVQVAGDNYLIPVDAKFEKESDVGEQGVRLADLIATLETAPSKMRIVILDACRNNPFSALNDVAGKGLAIVDAPAGTIVAYSTAPGSEAFDGSGAHSPYAAAFMRTMKHRNLPIEQFFKKVRVLVNDTTQARQTPWESTSLTSDFVFFADANVEAAAPVPAKVPIADLRTRSAADAYEVVVAEDSIEYYEEFVRLYPTDPRCDHVRRSLSRRQQMIAWHNATKSNNAQDYATFVSRHGNSDFANAARRLQERPRLVAVPFPLRGSSNSGPIFNRPSGPVAGRPSGPVIGTQSGPVVGKPGSAGKPGSPIVGKPGGQVIGTQSGPITGKPGGEVIKTNTPVTTTSVNPGGSVLGKDKVKQTGSGGVNPVLKKGPVAPKVLKANVQTNRVAVRRQVNTTTSRGSLRR
jgi:uncharacterized caspase-like protein